MKKNLKAIIEKRDAKTVEMSQMVDTVKTETRAFTDDEKAKFEDLKNEIENINATIKAIEEMEETEVEEVEDKGTDEETETEETETRAFKEYIRSTVLKKETRADINLDTGSNGAIIPKTISDRIISKVKEISPLFNTSQVYYTSGTLVIPVFDNNDNGGNITAAWQSEFEEINSTSGKFKTVELSSYVAGVLTKISRSMVNDTNFDLVNFVVNEIAKAIANFIEKEGIIGTDNKTVGVTSADVGVVAESATAITADNLIMLETSIPQVFTNNAAWIMNRNTFAKVRLLKNDNGEYLISKDFTGAMGYTLLGYPVYISESMPGIAAGTTPIVFGNFAEGFAFKLSKDIEIQILNEKFATQHAIGVTGWVQMDCNIVNKQAIKTLKMATA